MNEQDKKYCLSQRTFMGHCVGTIVEMAPANQPRKIDAIISNLITYFRENTKEFALDKNGKPFPETSDFVKYPMMTLKQMKTLVDGITGIKEVEELNLSNNEYNAGIGVNDENRSKFHFVDRYSKDDDDNDFIDLLALTRNTYVSMVDEILDFEERFDTKKRELIMFIRTKTTICEIRKYLKGDNAYKILDGVCEGIILKNAYIMEKDIISQTENIEDLLDEVLVSNNGKITNMLSDIYDKEECVNQGKKIFGAIWVDTETKPTLKSVAKYENGKWVLL